MKGPASRGEDAHQKEGGSAQNYTGEATKLKALLY